MTMKPRAVIKSKTLTWSAYWFLREIEGPWVKGGLYSLKAKHIFKLFQVHVLQKICLIVSCTEMVHDDMRFIFP